MDLFLYILTKYWCYVLDSSSFYFLIGVFVLFLIIQNPESKTVSKGTAKKGKYVTTMIDTKWSLVPFVLEMAEYMAEESQHNLWSFVDSISELNPALNVLGMLKLKRQKSIIQL